MLQSPRYPALHETHALIPMKSKSPRKRLDLLLVERGLADSPKSAQAMILAGEVKVDSARAPKAGAQTSTTARIDLATRQKYSSRGGLKLEGALEDFSINPANLLCLDIGSSTGGFTDCLLQHGAAGVFALDVNVSQLDWRLRQNPRVVQIERNARDLKPNDIPEPADLVVVDISFISVTKILAGAFACAKPGAHFLLLIKPQFELPRGDVPAGGIIKAPSLHKKAVASLQESAAKLGLHSVIVKPSRLRGAQGNQEFFLHARKPL